VKNKKTYITVAPRSSVLPVIFERMAMVAYVMPSSETTIKGKIVTTSNEFKKSNPAKPIKLPNESKKRIKKIKCKFRQHKRVNLRQEKPSAGIMFMLKIDRTFSRLSKNGGNFTVHVNEMLDDT